MKERNLWPFFEELGLEPAEIFLVLRTIAGGVSQPRGSKTLLGSPGQFIVGMTKKGNPWIAPTSSLSGAAIARLVEQCRVGATGPKRWCTFAMTAPFRTAGSFTSDRLHIRPLGEQSISSLSSLPPSPLPGLDRQPMKLGSPSRETGSGPAVAIGWPGPSLATCSIGAGSWATTDVCTQARGGSTVSISAASRSGRRTFSFIAGTVLEMVTMTDESKSARRWGSSCLVGAVLGMLSLLICGCGSPDAINSTAVDDCSRVYRWVMPARGKDTPCGYSVDIRATGSAGGPAGGVTPANFQLTSVSALVGDATPPARVHVTISLAGETLVDGETELRRDCGQLLGDVG